MFTMVNDARLGVAIQGVSIAEIAYQNAAAYARERCQGRALTPELRGDGAADPIVVHPDVRRMLFQMRSFVQGARALTLWVALQIDLSKRHPDPNERRRLASWVAILTPVIKAFCTDGGFEAANLALQCHGGHGYIRDMGIEQFVRDVRVTQVYEGTNGIQALDLVRRKLTLENGAAVRELLDHFADASAASASDRELAPLADSLHRALNELRQATDWINQRRAESVLDIAAGATDYLQLFGLVALGWAWMEMARLARDRLASGAGDAGFYRAKLATADFFMNYRLSEGAVHAHRAMLGAGRLMSMPAEAF
jgi:hypothetical protein